MRYVAVSGGADSTAMALLLHERDEEYEMVFSDTGAELPEVYWLLPRLENYVGRKLHVVSGGSFFQHLQSYGYLLPGVRARWCTRILKQAPQDRFFAAQDDVESVAVGIRADEQRRLYPNSRAPYEMVYPLADAGMDKPAVHALCARHGMENPVYEWRSNVSCFCCPFQRVGDWRGLLKHHPNLFRLAEEWEEASGRRSESGRFTWNDGWKLNDMRFVSEEQLGLFGEPYEEPCLICQT